MAKASDIKPTQVGRSEAQTLAAKQKAQAKQQGAQRLNAQDAARVASQAGFIPQNRRKSSKGFDVGDSSGAPIPLPDDDVDSAEWTQERLSSAQESLVLASGQFEEIAQSTENISMAEGVVGSSFLPTEADIQRMQVLADRSPIEAVPLEHASSDAKRFFDIEFGPKVSAGKKATALGLVVAGEKDAVETKDGDLDEQKLAGGMHRVTEKCNQAVREGKGMSEGISEKLNVQRTFVFRR